MLQTKEIQESTPPTHAGAETVPQLPEKLPGQLNAFDVFAFFLVTLAIGLSLPFGVVALIRNYL